MGSKGKKAKKPFGELAVERGYCTPEQVAAALKMQHASAARGEPRRLTGIIMVQEGIITTGELIDILREYEEEAEEE